MKKIKFTLYLPPDLNEWLKEQATLYNRSKNKHIIYLLQAIRLTSEANQQRLNEIDNPFIKAVKDKKWM